MSRTISVPASSRAKAHTRVIADAVATEITDCDVSLVLADDGRMSDELRHNIMYPYGDWRFDVQNGDTDLGYGEWKSHQIESNEGVVQPPDRDVSLVLADDGLSVADFTDWRYEVTNGDTSLSYGEWLEHKAESAEFVVPNIDHMTARRHVGDSPFIHQVAFPGFSDDARASVRAGLESGENDTELASLIAIARSMGITWNNPFDIDEGVVDRSAEPQDTTSVKVRNALESEDNDAVWETLTFLADEYEISYTEPDEEADDDRLCGCGARHAIHVD